MSSKASSGIWSSQPRTCLGDRRRCWLSRMMLRSRLAKSRYLSLDQKMATPQIPGGECGHCRAPIIDVFAEWTDDYQTKQGKQAILAGDIVFDCYYCGGPLQVILPLALILPQKK